jgi:hypothetical protein
MLAAMGRSAEARKVKVWVGTLAVAIAALTAIPASSAGATFHSFQGDRGTSCQIEVGAFASDSLGALSGPPQVGYSAVPTCQYPKAAKGNASAKGRRKACRKKKASGKRGKRGKRRCGKRKKRAGARRFAQLAVTTPPLVDLVDARLELLSASGAVTSVGTQTMQAPSLGYSCTVVGGTGCADSGRLMPAIPGASYTPEFTVRVEPPAGESWISRPAGCSAGPVPACALRSGAVSPEL